MVTDTWDTALGLLYIHMQQSRTFPQLLEKSEQYNKKLIKILQLEDTFLIESLSMLRFWATDGNRKWTFRRPGHFGLSQTFKLIISTSAKRLKNINVAVWRQAK